MQQLDAVLQRMQGLRAPWLTTEFYKAFWDILANYFLDVFLMKVWPKVYCHCFPAGLLLLTCRILKTGTLCLFALLKKNPVHGLSQKAGRSYEASHPLGPDILCTRQVYGQYLHNSRRFGDHKLITGLISINQKKVFDGVEHCFVWKTMERFRFSTGFPSLYDVQLNFVLEGRWVLCLHH